MHHFRFARVKKGDRGKGAMHLKLFYFLRSNANISLFLDYPYPKERKKKVRRDTENCEKEKNEITVYLVYQRAK